MPGFHCYTSYPRRRPAAPAFDLFGEILSSLVENATTSSTPTKRPSPPQPLASTKFDVYETKNQYVIEGELPGVYDKKSISLDFKDPQTLVVSGTIKRSSNPAAHDNNESHAEAEVESTEGVEVTHNEDRASTTETTDATLQADVAKAIEAEYSYSSGKRGASPAPSYKATVEDDVDTDDASVKSYEVIETPGVSTGPVSEAAVATSTSNAGSASASAKKVEKEKRYKAVRKYWVSERSTGTFARTFKFPTYVDHEAVKATLEHGVLTVIVPKRAPYVRSINIE